MAILFDGDTQTLHDTQPNKRIKVIVVHYGEQVPDLILRDVEALISELRGGQMAEDIEIANYHLDQGWESESICWETISIRWMDEQEFNNLPEWEA